MVTFLVGYLADSLFVLNNVSTFTVMNEIISRSAYIVETIDVLYGGLRRVNVGLIKRLKSFKFN